MSRLAVELPPDAVQAGEAAIRQALAAISVDAKVLTQTMVQHETQLKSLERGYRFVTASIDPLAKKQQDLERATKILDGALEHGVITADQHAAAVQKVTRFYGGFDQAKLAVDRLAASLDPAVAKTQRLAAEQQILNTALEKGVITQAEYDRILAQSNARTDDSAQKTGRFKDSLHDLKNELGKFAAGAIIFDIVSKSVTGLDDKLHFLGTSGREIVGDLVGVFEHLKHLDFSGAASDLSKVYVQALLDIRSAWEDTYRFIEGKESQRAEQIRTEAEYEKNLENVRQGAARRGAAVGAYSDLFGDPAELQRRAQAIVDAVRIAERQGNGAVGAQKMEGEVRSLLDAYDALGAKAPVDLQRIADTYGVVSSSAQTAADRTQQLDTKTRSANEAGQRKAEEFKRAYEQLIGKVDPLAGALTNLARVHDIVAEAQSRGIGTADQYAAALKKANDAVTLAQRNGAPLQLQNVGLPTETLDRMNSEYEIFTGKLKRGVELEEKSATEAERHDAAIAEAVQLYDDGIISAEALEKILAKIPDHFTVTTRDSSEFDASLNSALTGAEAIAEAISSWNSNLGKSIGMVIQIVGLFAQAAHAQQEWNKQSSHSASDRMSSAGSSAQLGAMIGEFGAGGKTTSFGGAGSGTYSGEGGTAGGAIGGLFGPGWGAFGAVIGSIIGGFLNKGADEGIAIMQGAAAEAGAKIIESEHGLGTKAGQIIDGAVAFIKQITDATGANIKDYADLSVKIRGDIVQVTVAGVTQRFRTLDEAMAFAIQQELKSSSIANLDPLIRDAIEAPSSGQSTDQLQKNTEAALKILAYQLGDIGMSLRQAGNEFDDLRETVVDFYPNLGLLKRGFNEIDAAELTKSLGALNASEIAKWTSSYYSITGQQVPLADQKKMKQAEIDVYNAEKALRIAELQERYAELGIKIQQGEAEAALGGAELRGRTAVLRGKAQIAQTEINVDQAAAGASIAALKIEYEAIGKLVEGLKALPDINIGDVRFGGNVGRFGGAVDRFGNSVDDFHQTQLQLREWLESNKYNSSTTALTLREQVDAAYATYQKDAARAPYDLEARKRLTGEATQFEELYKTYTGGAGGYLGSYRDVFLDIEATIKALSLQSYKDFKDAKIIYDDRLHKIGEDQLAVQRQSRDENRTGLAAIRTQSAANTNDMLKALNTGFRSLASALAATGTYDAYRG